MDEEKEKLLTRIAYCANGMFDSEADSNLGDAKEWKRHLRNATEKYYTYLFDKTGEQH